MKSILKPFPQNIVFTLALISLLAGAIGITNQNTAAAVPSPEQTQLAQNSQNHLNKIPKSIYNAVLRDASKRSGVAVRQLQITEVKKTTFGNPCQFQFGEICTKEYNPIEGWIVTVQVQEQSWTYHVNKSGSQLVLDPKVQVSNNAELPEAIANAVLSDAAKRSGLPVSRLKITQVTKKTFSNACVFNFGEICPQIFDPIEGWEVIVKVRNQFWTYHVDQSGSSIVLDPKVGK
jgi:uncharacterized protein YcnI